MRCPKCGFISFDYLTNCAKCSKDVSAAAQELQGTGIQAETVVFLELALDAALADAQVAAEDEQVAEEELTFSTTEEEPPTVVEERESSATVEQDDATATEELVIDEQDIPAIDLSSFTEAEDAPPDGEEPTAEATESQLEGVTEISLEESAPEPSLQEAPAAEGEAPPDLTEPAQDSDDHQPVEPPPVESLTEEEVGDDRQTMETAQAMTVGLEEISLADLVPGEEAPEPEMESEEEEAFDLNLDDVDLGLEDDEQGLLTDAEEDVFDLSDILPETLHRKDHQQQEAAAPSATTTQAADEDEMELVELEDFDLDLEDA